MLETAFVHTPEREREGLISTREHCRQMRGPSALVRFPTSYRKGSNTRTGPWLAHSPSSPDPWIVLADHSDCRARSATRTLGYRGTHHRGPPRPQAME